MSLERISVTIFDATRPFAVDSFNIPLVLGTTVDEEAVKDTLKVYSSNDLDAVAVDFPTTTSEYKTVAKMLAQDPHPRTFYIYSVTRTATPVVTDLSDALLAAKTAVEEAGLSMFYFVLLTEHEEVAGDLAEVADTVAALTTLCVTANEVGATAGAIKTLCDEINSDRVVIIAHDDPDDERPDAGCIGYWAGMPVGSLTLDTKTFNNVSAADWNSGDIATFLANTPGVSAPIPYVKQCGVPVLAGSWTTNGTYADLRRCKDWLKSRMKEALFALLLQNPKVPFTQHGLNMVRHAIEGVLNRASSVGILQKREGLGDGRWEIDIPTLSWLAKNDPTALAQRILRVIRIRCWPQGAIEGFDVEIYMSWSLD